MKKRFLLLSAVIVVAGLLGTAALMRRGDDHELRYETVIVERGTVHNVLRETGLIAPRDPVIVKTRIEGTLEWIIEDEAWVNQGDRIYVINDDEALRRVTEARTALLNNKQQLALTRLRLEHARRIEEQKVKAATRTMEFETIRYRILAAQPQGGARLIALHEQLQKREQRTARLRQDYEEAQDVYQQAQDTYLEKLDAQQYQKDAMLRVQTKIDEYDVRAEAEVDDTKPEQVKAHEEVLEQLAEARRHLDALRQSIPELEAAHDQAGVARDVVKVPRDRLLEKLEKREADEKELYIQLEIEKRGVELAQLQLDRQMAQLTLDENRRKYEDGQTAFQGGAISKAQLERLESSAAIAQNELDILDEQIKIAGHGTAPEVLTEAQLKMEQAQVRAQSAQAVHDRNLEALDQEIALLEAKMARSAYDINRLTKYFSSVIEFTITFLLKEHEALDDAEPDRRDQIDNDIAELKQELARVKADPPHIGASPIAGVVRLNKKWGRVYHSGDRVEENTVLMELFPALNMEAKTAVNEANVRHVRKGMSAVVTIPSLGGRRLSGRITLVAGIGRDKFEDRRNNDNPIFAGVTQFDIRIHLDNVTEDLRPGMTALIEIELDEEQDVLFLPRGAVQLEGEAATVLTSSPPGRRAIGGRLFGDDYFIVESGLSQNDQVFIERRRSR